MDGVTTAAESEAAEVLRRMALDEGLAARVLADPALAAVARRIARRYVAGESLPEALDRAQAIAARGHGVSLEFVGESIRDEQVAEEATRTFLDVAAGIGARGLPGSVSFDLSHVGLVIDPELGHRNAVRIAEAAAAAGAELMISAEGSGRTDLVLDTYERLASSHPHVGVTLQARLHRTPGDLRRVLALPGRVRLVKGAFSEPEEVALTRGSTALRGAYLEMAAELVRSGHPVSVATHDGELLAALEERCGDALGGGHVLFEMLLGLGGDSLDRLRGKGYRTSEYVVFGTQWWLYVLNRMAEEPGRVFTALADAAGR
ncbi:proline dehydrogenase [Kineococcus xinjiangensis]|uniref:Proline dehydrogenase n=1 Tax=Kineococcus xinjiangensis TaxID=512762 RepID=A0A2S6II43_9ACTN|nr:proline dehydrogenase family protein [Kineococcus xinjiangensis]PPK93887.1 proline dehydrogenase [Kineococcus xinjiangensis]